MPRTRHDPPRPQTLDSEGVGEMQAEPMPENSHLLRSARQQMEDELTQLQTTLDSLSDDYADRAETMVRDWLHQCRNKAKSRISAIDLADFFGEGEALDIQALPPAVEV
jgi:vacuolar-type H+-ATPase subunit H